MGQLTDPVKMAQIVLVLIMGCIIVMIWHCLECWYVISVEESLG